jgi:transcriptional regulator with XRE-family HTH domain
MDDVAGHMGNNIRQLREARGLTQQQMAKISGVPRPTWANLESGAANPTLAGADKGGDGAAGLARGADQPAARDIEVLRRREPCRSASAAR